MGASDSNAIGNTVTISGGTVKEVIGGIGNINAGANNPGAGNSVTISGRAEIQGDVYGGKGTNGNATGNSVTLKGGKFTGSSVNIYGGWAGNTATGNTVTLDTNFAGDHSHVSLWGGYAWRGGDAVTGNELYVNTGAGKSLTLGGVNNFAMLDFRPAGGDVSVDALSNIGDLYKRDTGTLTVGTLDVTDRDTSLNLDRTAAAQVAFTNVKLGDQTLTADARFGGEATIETLTLTGAGRLVDSGGALKIGSLTIDGGTLDDNNWDGLLGAGRTYTTTDDITLESGGLTVDLTSGSSGQTLDRKLTGTGALTKTGAGMVTLSATNDYSGKTQVNAGWLWLQNAAATGTGDVELASGTVLSLQFDGTYANKISGAGRVITGGFPGYTVTLNNAANNYGGGTTVESGTLQLDNTNAAGTGLVGLYPYANLRLATEGTFANQIDGDATSKVFVAPGAGKTLILNNAANNYGGGTTVESGTLELKDANAAGTGQVDVAGGAALRLSASGIYTNSALQGVSGSTLEVMKNGAQVNTISGFENYTFAASALDENSAALTLTNQGGALDMSSSTVRIDSTGGGLSLALGDAATLIETVGSTLNATQSTVTQWVDDVANGLKEAVYTLAQKGTTMLTATVNELYLYGTGGDPAQNTNGQRPTGNTLDFTTGTATAAFGGRATTGEVSGNTVNMSGGTLVKLTDDTHPNYTLSGNAYGGYADAGSATKNTVNMTGGSAQNVYGALANGTGNVASNAVGISGGTVSGNIYGARTMDGEATGNTVTITGGALGNATGAHSAVGAVRNNTVRISGDSTSLKSVWGGYANDGDASGNRVEMSGGTVQFNVYGGRTDNYGHAATNNTVILTGGTVTQDVFGAFVNRDTAANNAVLISGGAVQRDVYGGRVHTGNANGNTITLSGAPDLSASQLYGGHVAGPNGGNAVVGNTLAVQSKGMTVANIHNFENLYFILPKDIRNGDTMLEATDGKATQFAAAKTNVGVAVEAGSKPLQAGDAVTLLKNDSGLLGAGGNPLQGTDYALADLNGKTIPGVQGFSLNYEFELSNTDKTLDAKVKGQDPTPTPPTPTPPTPTPPQPTPPQPTPPQPTPPQPTPPQPTPPAPQVNPQTKAVVEGRVAALGALNLGTDQIVRMTGNLPNRTGGGAPNFGGSGGANGKGAGNDTTVFAEISGHRQKIKTGSHVNVNGAAAIVGAAKAIPLAGGGTAAVGAFFEYGDGSFKTHNGFDTGDVNGKGNSDYYGAGVLAKATLAGNGNGAPFVEGSLHAGSIRNNWHTDDLRDAVTGQRAQYDIRTPYMGAHVGAGYRWQTGAASHVEAYGQYLYTHMDGKDTNVALDPYHFNAVKSSRTRLGAKGTWAVSNTTSAYAGAAWEREFDGTARATAYSFDVPAPTMKGNSAVLDAGLTFQPKRNFSTNVGVTGYAGKRKGASANVEVQYLF